MITKRAVNVFLFSFFPAYLLSFISQLLTFTVSYHIQTGVDGSHGRTLLDHKNEIGRIISTGNFLFLYCIIMILTVFLRVFVAEYFPLLFKRYKYFCPPSLTFSVKLLLQHKCVDNCARYKPMNKQISD